MSVKRQRISPRRLFVILSIITLILLIGSALLQRVVFRAAQVNTAVYITPPQATVAPLSNQSLQIHANIDGTGYVASAQISLKYSDIIKIVDTQAAVGWQTEKVATTNGVVDWVLVPSSDIGTVAKLTGDALVGTVDYQAVKAGSSSFMLDSNTQIMAIDPAQNPSLYNAASSLQSAFVLASDSGASTNTGAIAQDSSTIKPVDYQTNQMQSVNALAGATDADITVSTNSSVLLTVDFGLNQNNLSNQVKTKVSGTTGVATLLGLSPNTSYFYKVTATDTTKSSQQVSKIYSFATKMASTANSPVVKAEILTLPTLAKDTSTIYFNGLDQNGKVVENWTPEVSVKADQATVSDVQKQGDLYSVTITPIVKTTLTTNISIYSAALMVGSTSINFDPNRIVTTTATDAPISSTSSALASPIVLALMFIGLIVLLLILSSAYVFVTKKR